MKTPEDIKKGLAEAPHVKYVVDDQSRDDVHYERYGVAIGYILRDQIYIYITQLEARLAQVERERDAAVADLTDSSDCEYCKHEPIFHTCPGTNCHACERDCPCARCSHRRRNGFEWRGVCAENTKED